MFESYINKIYANLHIELDKTLYDSENHLIRMKSKI